MQPLQSIGSTTIGFFLSLCLAGAAPAYAQDRWDPASAQNFSSLGHWQHKDGTAPTWTDLDAGESDDAAGFAVLPGAGDLITRAAFRDFRMHLEFWIPYEPEKTGQDRGNSGVFLHSLYEIQILDTWENETYPDGVCGALYKQAAPATVPAAKRRPEQWQTYDLDFRAPQIDSTGQVARAGEVTLWHNGYLVLNRVPILRPTGSAGRQPQHGVGPVRLQDHGSAVRFRNVLIWP